MSACITAVARAKDKYPGLWVHIFRSQQNWALRSSNASAFLEESTASLQVVLGTMGCTMGWPNWYFPLAARMPGDLLYMNRIFIASVAPL
jgi:hypothetical protein